MFHLGFSFLGWVSGGKGQASNKSISQSTFLEWKKGKICFWWVAYKPRTGRERSKRCAAALRANQGPGLAFLAREDLQEGAPVVQKEGEHRSGAAGISTT